MQPSVIVGTLVGAGAVTAWRLRETQRPLSLPAIVFPPLGMSTGLCMFLYPPTRVPVSWGLAAFVLGALLFSYPLIHTSKLWIQGEQVFLRRSHAFVAVILGLVALRFALRDYVEQYVDTLRTGSLFFLLAFGMILRWRAGMLREYLRLRKQIEASGGTPPPTA